METIDTFRPKYQAFLESNMLARRRTELAFADAEDLVTLGQNGDEQKAFWSSPLYLM